MSVVLVVLSLVLWPLSKNTYRRVSSALASSVLGRECIEDENYACTTALDLYTHRLTCNKMP